MKEQARELDSTVGNQQTMYFIYQNYAMKPHTRYTYYDRLSRPSRCLNMGIWAGHSSGGRALAYKGWDHPIKPACMAGAFTVWAIFFSNQWSTTGPSKAVARTVLSV